MITGDIKQKVDDVWQTFWNNGFTQPSAIFEQITYLLFMKMLDDKQREKEAIANLTGDVLLNPTFPSGTCHIMKCVGTCSKNWSRPKCWIGCATMYLSICVM